MFDPVVRTVLVPLLLLTSSPAESQQIPSSTVLRQVEGMRLTYNPTAFEVEDPAEARATELKAILASRASVVLARPLAYGRSRLEAGTYPLTIQSTPRGTVYFVLGQGPSSSAGEVADGEADDEGGAAMGLAGKLPDGADLRTPRSRPQKRGESRSPRHMEPADRDRPGEKQKGRSAVPGRKSGGASEEDGTRSVPEKLAGQGDRFLRARVHFRPAAGITNGPEYRLRAIDRGRRVELSVQAGATYGRANFRWAETGTDERSE